MSEFEKIVSLLIKKELQSIPKPPRELKVEKDQFETTAEFNARVVKTRKNQKQIVAKYKRDYALKKQQAHKRALKFTWGKPFIKNLMYDADNGYFVADIRFKEKKDFNKKVAIKVPKKQARQFFKDASSLQPNAIFEFNGKSVQLKDIQIPYKKKVYRAQFTNLRIDDTRIAVNLKNDIHVDTSINTSITIANNTVTSFDASNLRSYSDLDKLLRASKSVKKSSKKWLFVVGIEKYEFTDEIVYAQRSAEMFVKVAQKKLGVTKQNSYVMINAGATQAKIKTNMKRMLRKVRNGDTIYFYYNGHGVPIPSLKFQPFMLASDTEPDFVADESFFALQNIYNKLSNSKASKIVAIVDSCFSGVTDGKAVLKGVAATRMKAKKVSFNKQKMVVMSAGKASQYSNGYDKKGHRLFSFFVMKNIISGDTQVKTLFKNIKTQTYRTSREEYGDVRLQEPTIDGNHTMRI
ncbi:caspase family protein [Sulfurimonas sp. SAG-AH-194-I05]|nr:caspase family protein [Sulfurimonas sp. SAG-AH-194-I05]MDF1874227.1 caspase family protein [Sulfurimonas sp. SAG-AH-194-I05]